MGYQKIGIDMRPGHLEQSLHIFPIFIEFIQNQNMGLKASIYPFGDGSFEIEGVDPVSFHGQDGLDGVILGLKILSKI